MGMVNTRTNFNIGDTVTLKNNGLKGTVKDMITDLYMVELENGSIDAYYSRQLDINL